MHKSSYLVGPIDAKGALTVDFELPGSLPLDQLPQVIERDRMHMAKRPGMRHKHLPMRIDSGTGNFLSGGRYLFDTVENAEKYRSWAENEFVLDGMKFFERPFFINPVCHTWSVIAAQDLADIHTAHTVIRSERWQLPPGNHPLEHAWSSIHQEAERRSLASVWLLQNVKSRLAGLISVAGPGMPGVHQSDGASLRALESSPSLGAVFEQQGWAKMFDRTSWVLTIWFPIVDRGTEPSALWPNSPPWPAPPYACGNLGCTG
jgi:hypothetical protein